MAAIDVRDLTRRFGDFVAVDDLSFDVEPGEIFGFLGANGAGKSTTIRMLCGLLQPTTGTALVGGIDVARDPEGVKRRIGYMSQQFSLYELLTVDQNIRFFGGIYGLRGAALRRAPRSSCSRWPASTAARTTLTRDLAGRLAAAAGARLRHPPRAADRVPRRADRRRRSAVAPPVLGPDRRPVAAGRDRARHHALPRRGGALPPHRDHPRRQARRARHRRPSSSRSFADRPISRSRRRSPVAAMRALDAHAGGREDQPVRHRGPRRAATGAATPATIVRRALDARRHRRRRRSRASCRRSRTSSSTSSSGREPRACGRRSRSAARSCARSSAIGGRC